MKRSSIDFRRGFSRAPHPPPRHGCVLRVGGAARRPVAAGPAGGGRRAARPARGGRGRQLRGAEVRGALGDVDGAGGAALPRAGRGAPRLRPLPVRLGPHLRHVPLGHPPRRAPLARRGVPRRDPQRLERAARHDRGAAAEAVDPRRDGAHRLGRGRAQQVPREDRLRLGQARRPDRHSRRAGRRLPAATPRRCALGGRPRHREAAPDRRGGEARRRAHRRPPRAAARRRQPHRLAAPARRGQGRPSRQPRPRRQVVRLGAHLPDRPHRSGRDPARARRAGAARGGVARTQEARGPHRHHQGALLRLHHRHPQPQRGPRHPRRRADRPAGAAAAGPDRGLHAARPPARGDHAQPVGRGRRPARPRASDPAALRGVTAGRGSGPGRRADSRTAG